MKRAPGLLAALGLASAAAAATWTGAGTDDNWTTAANWGGTAPAAGAALTFAGSARTAPVNDFAAGTAFGGVTFAADAAPFTPEGNLGCWVDRTLWGGHILQPRFAPEGTAGLLASPATALLGVLAGISCAVRFPAHARRRPCSCLERFWSSRGWRCRRSFRSGRPSGRPPSSS